MSVQLDKKVAETGTRFLIFPQPRFLKAFSKPEIVYISVTPDEIQPGPADDRMFVVDAVYKLPYSKLFRPPYGRDSPANPPVKPGEDGHFDYLKPDTREFSCATMYATVRRILDSWEDYFDKERIDWHFESEFSRLEMIPLIEWDNAQSGYGFLEFGYSPRPGGGIDHKRPYCENFDVLAHELGHSILFSEVGVPSSPMDEGIDYDGMHESAGDLVAIISALHFNSVVDHLLESTKGNLFTINELGRVGELSESREIRVAFNYYRMSDVGTEPNDRSLPLTGAIFDVMVEMFQKYLVERGLISQTLADRSSGKPGGNQKPAQIQADFNKAYSKNKEGFKDALLDARDYLGRLLAKTWSSLNPDFLSYHDILRALIRADRELDEDGKGKHQETIRECFAWREISIVPGSFLIRTHTVRDCAFNNQAVSFDLSSIDDNGLYALAEKLTDEIKKRDFVGK